MFSKIDMFVYSGTGNTLKAAQCIGDAGEKTGIGYEIRMIDTKSRPEDYEPDPDRLLGIMAPTIGAIQPMSFFGFILRLPKGNGQKAFLASTGAWTKVGPVFLPGYVGFGLYLAALFLVIKGFQVVGINGFGMPHNWTTLIPAYSRKLEKRINEEIRPVTERFTLDLLSGKRVYKRIGDLIFTILIFPLPFLFILLGHLFLAKTMFAGSDCNGCGLCAENCPRKAIRMVGKKRKRPYWTYKCEQCMRCAGYCPRKAIDSNSVILLAFILVFWTFSVDTLIIGWLRPLFASAGPTLDIIIFYALEYVLFVLIMAVIYAIFHLLGRQKTVNKVFTVLSFTHYWRKYRQVDEKIGAFARSVETKQG